MTVSVQTVRAQIERVVLRDQRYPSADFYHLREGGRWLAAQAWFAGRGFSDAIEPRVAARGSGMSIEEAAVVGVALQMAIDWGTEEYLRMNFGQDAGKAVGDKANTI